MAQQNRTTLKGYFNTGDKPTEQQFIDLIDSAPNISEDGDVAASLSTHIADNTVHHTTAEIQAIGDARYPQISNNLSELNAAGARANLGLTDAEIKTRYESNANTNAYTDTEVAKVANLPADQSAVNTTNSNHIADNTIHLNATDVQGIGDARYERAELTFTALTLAATTTITVLAGVKDFKRTLNINVNTNPTLEVALGDAIKGIVVISNTSGVQQAVSLTGDYMLGGKVNIITIEDGEIYEVNYLKSPIGEAWTYEIYTAIV